MSEGEERVVVVEHQRQVLFTGAEQQAEIERLRALLREARELLDSLPKSGQSFSWFHRYKNWLDSLLKSTP